MICRLSDTPGLTPEQREVYLESERLWAESERVYTLKHGPKINGGELRDHLAALAMQVVLSNDRCGTLTEGMLCDPPQAEYEPAHARFREKLAERCYALADAMMEVRAR